MRHEFDAIELACIDNSSLRVAQIRIVKDGDGVGEVGRGLGVFRPVPVPQVIAEPVYNVKELKKKVVNFSLQLTINY